MAAFQNGLSWRHQRGRQRRREKTKDAVGERQKMKKRKRKRQRQQLPWTTRSSAPWKAARMQDRVETETERMVSLGDPVWVGRVEREEGEWEGEGG